MLERTNPTYFSKWALNVGNNAAGDFVIDNLNDTKGPIVYINDTGNVGIGETAPFTPLHITGTDAMTTFETSQSDTGSLGLQFKHSTTGGSTTYIKSAIISKAVGVAAGLADMYFILDSSSDAGVWDESTDTKLIIKNSGNVGIGTTNPGVKLVTYGAGGLPVTSGTTQTYGLLRLQLSTNSVLDMGINQVSPYHAWIQSTDTGNLALNNPLLLNPNGGNVGIGTVSPGAKLNVYNSAAGYVTKFDTGSGNYAFSAYQVAGADKGYIQWNINDAANAVGTSMILNNIQGKLILQDSSYTGITLSGGNVGIGTTSPNSKLEVAGYINSTSGGFAFPDGSVQTTASSMQMKTGTYTGNGIDNRNIDIGVDLLNAEYKWLVIKGLTGYGMHKFGHQTTDISNYFTDGTSIANGIQAWTTTGFQVGTTYINTNTVVYNYVVFWQN
ncbi:hypothetical protein KJ671_03325 [Patescibacteria group bacterium]|nr:hypothetical protein [Patescibacteria group bacterium]